MREQHGRGLSELKSAAREALQLGARYAEAGRAWLNQRTTMMNQRHDPPEWRDQDRHGSGPRAGRGYGKPDEGPAQSRYGQSGEHGEYGAASADRGQSYASPEQRAHPQHPHDSGWQPSGRSYPPDQQGRHYGSMHEHYGQTPPYPGHERGSDGHNAPRASMGTQAQSDYDEHQRSNRGEHGEHGYGGGGGYAGYAGQSMAERGTHLEDPSLGIGRYGGGRQMDYGAGIDEDYPRRSAQYGRGYGAGSGYTDNNAHPQQSRHAHGEGSQPSYRGRGPRHYTRSDERVLEDICERLTHDDYIDASDVTVRVDSGMVTLSGEVPERWMKHRAEDMADACTGVRQVENQLRVQGGNRSQGAYSSRSTGNDRITGGHGDTGGTSPSSGTQTH